jgi:hypothetical protein
MMIPGISNDSFLRRMKTNPAKETSSISLFFFRRSEGSVIK